MLALQLLTWIVIQFQVAPGQRVETDVSGKCEANYKIQDSMIQKIKANCVSDFSEMKNDVSWQQSNLYGNLN